MNVTRVASRLAGAVLPALLLSGCLLIGTTEHRIRLNENGSGEAVMRLIDIRSDARSDSALARDYAVMMASIQKEGVEAFEKGGRKVTAKRFYASGDTLSAEITYTFPNLDQIEGLKVREDELFVVVNEGREVVRTNGRVKSWTRGAQRIVWPRDAKRLMYQISEKSVPSSTSLAPLYRKFGYSTPEGAH